MASIIITTGQQEGHFYPLGRRTNVIGRDEGLFIQVLDTLVSRKHIQIRFDDKSNRYLVFDMKSRNGVYVNDQKIADETPLSEGDMIAIGGTRLLFTEKDFDSKDSAMLYYKKVGERMRVTSYNPQDAETSPSE